MGAVSKRCGLIVGLLWFAVHAAAVAVVWGMWGGPDMFGGWSQKRIEHIFGWFLVLVVVDSVIAGMAARWAYGLWDRSRRVRFDEAVAAECAVRAVAMRERGEGRGPLALPRGS